MTVRRLSLFLLMFAVVIGFADRVTNQVAHDAILGAMADSSQYLVDHVNPFRRMVTAFVRWRELVQENNQLKERNALLAMQAARAGVLGEENEFLRTVARIAREQTRESIAAGIFNIQYAPGAFTAIVNKGLDVPIEKGAVVVTRQGQLVGVVIDVLSHTARVRLINDAGLEIAVQVLGRTTNGIAKGKGSEGLSFELVAQGEDIEQDDIIITTGSDVFPAGLVVGVVTHVTRNESGIFQEVRLSPAADPTADSQILIINP